MSSMLMAKRLRLATVSVGLLTAWACTVADKGEYTFTDNPTGGAGHGGTGHAGSGAAASGGKSGSGTAGTLAKGGRAGRGGTSGAGGSGATGGSAEGGEGGMAGAGAISGGGGKAGKGGSAGKAGSAGKGSVGSGGSSAGEAGAGGEGGAISSCSPDPCVHGQCSTSSGQPVCTCDVGYEGPRCAINHNDCAPNPCLHNGVCTDRINDFKCDCTGTGYTGTTCQTPAPCTPNPCLNGGVCTASGTTYTCNCTGTGFEGTTCQTNHNDCTGTGCHENEGGICTDLVNGFSCSYYTSCGKAYTAGHTTPGLYYIDPDGGDPSNAAERYCYRTTTLSGLGMGVHAAAYSPNWVEFSLSDFTAFPGAFKYLYDKQNGVTTLVTGSSNWGVDNCCFRDATGGIGVGTSLTFLAPAQVNSSSYDCESGYTAATMWLSQGTAGPVSSVPLDPAFITGWTDTATACPISSTNYAFYWQETPDP